MTEKSEKLRFAKVSALLFTIVFMAYYFYGLRAVFVALVSVFSSVIGEYLCCAAMKRKYDWADESPVMSGLLLALLMPASVPYTIMAFAAAFMATVCKHAFGGNGNLIFCPVCVAYIFTSLCFPSDILRYPTPAPFGAISLDNAVGDALTHSYTYYLDSGASSTFSLLDLVWGKIVGPMGTSAILITLICAVSLYFFGDIPTVAFFSGFGANVLINVIFPVGETGWYAVLNSLVAGSYLFALVFLACDPRYVPKRALSQILYGVIFAGGSYLIRRYTNVENGAVYALPMICVFRDELDRLSDALERFIMFLLDKTNSFAKRCVKLFDRLCDHISDKIVAAQKKRDAEKIEDTSESETDADADVTETAAGTGDNAAAEDSNGSEPESVEADKDE